MTRFRGSVGETGQHPLITLENSSQVWAQVVEALPQRDRHPIVVMSRVPAVRRHRSAALPFHGHLRRATNTNFLRSVPFHCRMKPPPLSPPPPAAWTPARRPAAGRDQRVMSRFWDQVSPTGSRLRALRLARTTLVIQGFVTTGISVMALLLAALAAASGAQGGLPFAGLALVVTVLGGLIAWGIFVASARLGVRSVRARYLTILGEFFILAAGVPMTALGNYATQNAGTPTNPGTDGPFGDGANGLILLTGMTYAGGAVVIMVLLLFAPTVRRAFRT